MLKVSSERKNSWVNVLFGGHLHMAIYLPSLLKVHSWANHNPKWKFWKEPHRYYIETTQKNGVQDVSDYSDRLIWIQVLAELKKHIENPQ